MLESIHKTTASGTPTIVILNIDKPIILKEFIDEVSVVTGAFGAADPTILGILLGKAAPGGKLPFDLPSDRPSVTT